MSESTPKQRGSEVPKGASSRLRAVETPPDDPGRDYADQIGRPGEPPFTRGIYPDMFLGRVWTMRQYAGFSTPRETNDRFRGLIDRGQTGLSVAFDLPTQLGYDSDHPMAEGEVGRVGVAIDGIWDMVELLEELPLDRITTSMTINATANILLALYVAAAKARGIPQEALGGTVQNDILKEYVSRGTYIYPVEEGMDLCVDLMAYCLKHLPRWNPISISGYHMREAGASAAQEVGYTLAHAIAYGEAARERGLQLERLLPTFSFFFGVHNNFLEEIAKFRAARRLWSRLVPERFGIDDARCRRLRFHAQTAGCTLASQQPLNNSVRTSLQALAAVLGGVQSLHVNAYDEALGLPSEGGAELALRTQQVIADETGVTETVDPFGGSYAIERLTDLLEEESRAHLETIEAQGGAVEAAANGFTSGQIAEVAFAEQRAFENGDIVRVGVNRYAGEEEDPAGPAFRHNPRAEDRQRRRVGDSRSTRDPDGADQMLDRVAGASAGDGGTTEAMVDAVGAQVTVGEIADRLRQRYGTYGGETE